MKHSYHYGWCPQFKESWSRCAPVPGTNGNTRTRGTGSHSVHFQSCSAGFPAPSRLWKHNTIIKETFPFIRGVTLMVSTHAEGTPSVKKIPKPNSNSSTFWLFVTFEEEQSPRGYSLLIIVIISYLHQFYKKYFYGLALTL